MSDDEFQTRLTFVIGQFCLIGTRGFERTLMEHLSEGGWNSSVDDKQLTGMAGSCKFAFRSVSRHPPASVEGVITHSLTQWMMFVLEGHIGKKVSIVTGNC